MMLKYRGEYKPLKSPKNDRLAKIKPVKKS
jgi:hypothetical protein